MNQERVKSQSSQLLVSAGKSSRLDAIRKKAGQQIEGAEVNAKAKHQPFVLGLNQQTKDALQQANDNVDKRMESILNGYPAGKKNTFFKLKYGVGTDKVKTMLIKDIFKLLEISSKQLTYYPLIENMDLSGKLADAK